jgi:hypothetical protein
MPHRAIDEVIMRSHTWLLLAALALLGPGPLTWADEAKEIKALVSQAIAARGGTARLEKLQAAVWKSEGERPGRTTRATLYGQLPGKFRLESQRTVDGKTHLFIKIVNGDRGWIIEGGKTRPMTREELALTRRTFYHKHLDATLLPLRDKGVTIKALGDRVVEGKPVVGIQVSRKGFPDSRMYFDKKTKLLVKSARQVEDATGKTMVQELHYSDYRDHDGIKIAHRTRRVVDGKPEGDVKITEFDIRKGLDPSLFLPMDAGEKSNP